LKRLVEPEHPVEIYEVYGPYGDLLRGLFWRLDQDEQARAA